MNKIITMLAAAVMLTTQPLMGSQILEQARRKQVMDLRWLVLEADALSNLQAEHSIIIDFSIDSAFGEPKNNIDNKYVIKQRAGESITSHLRALERSLGREVFGLYEIQIALRRQVRLIGTADIEKTFPDYTTQPGDVIVLKPLPL